MRPTGIEEEQVVAWRRERLAEAGFSLPLAARVASDPCYDLHALIELVERPLSATFNIKSPDAQIDRLVAALTPHQPYLRGAPPGLPFHWDRPTIQAGLNFTLTTAIGDLDLLGEVSGGGSYDELIPFTQGVSAFGFSFRVVTLERLIQLKRAAGRPKDFEIIAELQALLEERNRLEPR